ncbi:uncharacterized protein B0T15DRAFT_574365 [Chaetomium strumarium]|uniref:Uncharacterized protein n=1 Tax=Chaetomium strumarium TaxID=1170767 RepID=A0AAJ0GWU7_9PEZI|nr:hypothetical protein B0T15DRAFT_574365 [Chaetomium strumarium]
MPDHITGHTYSSFASPLDSPEPTSIVLQLAGILPLTALIEFINVPTKLHVFELAGCVPLWNWPMTPARARLLLATLDNAHACCLDREERCTALHCVDGRYGDCYPSSTPTRLAVASQSTQAVRVANTCPNMRERSIRRQTLNLVLLERAGGVPSTSVPFGSLRRSKSWTRFRSRALACGGWLALASTLVLRLASGLYVAAAYLLLLPLTGLAVRATHGGGGRRLVDDGVSGRTEYQPLVLCTSSWNGTHWWAFMGPSPIVNSLLNKPLFRTGASPGRTQRLWSAVLQVLIAGQWAVALLSCAQQDWNAIVISIWLAFCAIASSFLIKPHDCVRDWLHTLERRTSWINPILAHCEERREWESALLEYIENGVPTDQEATKKYWWKFITEGVESRYPETLVA